MNTELQPRVKYKILQLKSHTDEVLDSCKIEVPYPRYKRSRSLTKKLKKNSLRNKINSSAENKKGYDLLRVAKQKK